MKPKKWLPDAQTLSLLFVVLVGILFYLGLSNIGALQARFGMLMKVVTPFLAGFAVAYLLNEPTNFFERLYRRVKYSRILAILTVYLLAVVLAILLLNLVVPQVMESIMVFIRNVNSYLRNLNQFAEELIDRFHFDEEMLEVVLASYNDLVKQSTSWVAAIIPQTLDFGMAIGSGLISAVTAIAASVYMLAGKTRLIRQLRKLIYAFVPTARAERFLQLSRRANRIFSGFVTGTIVDSVIVGILCFLFCWIFGIPFPMLITVIIAVTNVIPFFGPIIGAIPSIMILLIVDPWSALWFGIFIILLQQFDGNILAPKILGDSTGLSAIWVLVAIVVGGGLFGFLGMLLGVPTFAVLYGIMSELVTAKLQRKGITADGTPIEPREPEPNPLEEPEPTKQESSK